MGSVVTIPTGKVLVLPSILFYEDFQSPVISGYQQGQLPDNGNWIGSTEGFGSDRKGMNNADSTDWVADGADNQGFDCNYTNSGAGTVEGVIGTIMLNSVTYKLTATIAYDKHNSQPHGSPSGDYDILLCSLPLGTPDRDDFRAVGPWIGSEFINVTGAVADDGLIHTVSATYTTDPVTDAARAGQDLGVCIDGETSHAIHTSIKVEII